MNELASLPNTRTERPSDAADPAVAASFAGDTDSLVTYRPRARTRAAADDAGIADTSSGITHAPVPPPAPPQPPAASSAAPSPGEPTPPARSVTVRANRFLGAVLDEFQRAAKRHPRINSLHEGYAIILEEVDELWQETRKRKEKRNPKATRTELMQVAAMCVRTALDLDLEP